MDVGTAKVGLEDRARARHHGLDLVDPDQRFSAGEFARRARLWIRDIRSRGRIPILVGGTGFFLRALVQPIFREPPLDPGRRRALRQFLARADREELERWVIALDPERAVVAAAGGRQRMSRTLEVALLTGRPLSWWHRQGAPGAAPLSGVVLYVDIAREDLDRRIDSRVDEMLAGGLVAEVRSLLDAGYTPHDSGMTSVGYREIAAHLAGEIDLDEALERTRGATRRYARRQRTWFRNQLPPLAHTLDARASEGALVEETLQVWERAVAPLRAKTPHHRREDEIPEPEEPGAGVGRERGEEET
jgi:tRNA dimethylallyltransferase